MNLNKKIIKILIYFAKKIEKNNNVDFSIILKNIKMIKIYLIYKKYFLKKY
jgi:hypothetical protein